ncbi:MAG: mechanosensitive ion channel family protein [SAR86 cluster bacterium]|jgi:MscS family membrane protein|nr:mechanosensitive ion channel family protein [SAR86 cluster bacterium]
MINEFWNLIQATWQTGIRGIGIDQLIICLLIIFGGLITRSLISTKLVDKLANLTKYTESGFDDEIVESLRAPIGMIPIAFALYLITIFLPLTGSLDLIITNLVVMVVIYTIFSALSNITKPFFSLLGESTWLTQAMSLWLNRVAKVIIWIIGITMMLDVWGIEIGPIIAGLGLFSVAVALGAQDMFKNIIAGIFIISEKRFQHGDRIRVGDDLHGIVENIGFRSTEVRLLDTSPVFVPNTDLSDAQLINHQNMSYRRINWTINVLYSTSVQELKDICHETELFIKDCEDFSENPNQENFVKVTELGSSSIDITILCYAEPMDFTNFSQVKQNLIFEIMDIVKRNNSDFAFPSRTVYMDNSEE